MKKIAVIVALSAGLGGCLTIPSLQQSKSLIGKPVSEAVARYGPPDQAVTDGAASYKWSAGRRLGACTLSVKTDNTGTITNASVIAIGFNTCEGVLQQQPPR